MVTISLEHEKCDVSRSNRLYWQATQTQTLSAHLWGKTASMESNDCLLGHLHPKPEYLDWSLDCFPGRLPALAGIWEAADESSSDLSPCHPHARPELSS